MPIQRKYVEIVTAPPDGADGGILVDLPSKRQQPPVGAMSPVKRHDAEVVLTPTDWENTSIAIDAPRQREQEVIVIPMPIKRKDVEIIFTPRHRTYHIIAYGPQPNQR